MNRVWILYVEDSEDDLRLAWEILPRAEYPVTWAANGASARSHLAAQRFDLLLLDHGLPDTNGLLLLEEIRRTHPRLPVVVVTGRKDDALALSTLAKGAAGYVCKEDLAQLLRPTIERVLAAASPPDDGASTEHLLRFGRLSQILLATMGEGVLLVDAEGVVTYANEAAGEMLGEAPTSLLGRQAGDLFDPATRAQFLASHAAFVARTPPAAARFEGRLRESVPVFVSARSMLEDLGHSEACLLVLVIELLLEANGFEVIRLTRPGTLPLPEREVPFDILLTEIVFDGVADRDVVRRLRVEFSCPVGVLTARAQDRVDGAVFVLAKPVVPDVFLERVSHALERPLHQYYEAIFDMLETPICLADGKGLVVRYNRAWGNLFRLMASEEPGREIASAFPSDVPAPEILARLLAVARHARKDEILIEAAGADGAPRTHAVTFAAIGTQAGESHVLLTIGGEPEPESLMPQARAALLSLLEDLDAARIEVSRANERLLGLDRMKSDFLSTVSHELRTPIAVIKGSVENLLDGLLGEMDARQKSTFEIVLRNARRLARLIENLLDLSHIERGAFEIQRREIDLAETVRLSVEEIQPVARKTGIALDLDLPAEAVPLAADADRIGQVVVNLLDNALRFARTRVAVRLEAEGDNGRIVVEDDGPGVPPEDIGGIFERFTRVRNHGHLSHTGLGLSIVRAIAEGHGGRVWAENRADGGGARFTVLLPLSREAPAGAAR